MQIRGVTFLKIEKSRCRPFKKREGGEESQVYLVRDDDDDDDDDGDAMKERFLFCGGGGASVHIGSCGSGPFLSKRKASVCFAARKRTSKHRQAKRTRKSRAYPVVRIIIKTYTGRDKGEGNTYVSISFE